MNPPHDRPKLRNAIKAVLGLASYHNGADNGVGLLRLLDWAIREAFKSKIENEHVQLIRDTIIYLDTAGQLPEEK